MGRFFILVAVFGFFFVAPSDAAQLYNSQKKKAVSGETMRDLVPAPPPVKTTQPSAPRVGAPAPAPDGDRGSSDYVRLVAQKCVGQWESYACLRGLSSVSMAATTDYAERLGQPVEAPDMVHLKEECAASTAALELDDVPAYAQRSALTSCVNVIADLHGKTKVRPALTLYQLMIGGVWCLGDQAQECRALEQRLKQAL